MTQAEMREELAIARIMLAALSLPRGANRFTFPSDEWFLAETYYRSRQLPDGRWIAVRDMLFTTGLYVDIDEWSWRTRFCFEHAAEAVQALEEWDGTGDPPGMWIKEKPSNRMNPRWLDAAKREIVQVRETPGGGPAAGDLREGGARSALVKPSHPPKRTPQWTSGNSTNASNSSSVGWRRLSTFAWAPDRMRRRSRGRKTAR